MSTDDRATHWLPEICYEEADEGLTSKIPFIDEGTGNVFATFSDRSIWIRYSKFCSCLGSYAFGANINNED